MDTLLHVLAHTLVYEPPGVALSNWFIVINPLLERRKPHKIQSRSNPSAEIEEQFVIKVVLFDVDGVLANGEPFSQHLARDYGITSEMTSSFFNGRFLECLVGNADLKQELVDHLHQWGWQGSVEEFVSYWFGCEHSIDEPLVASIQRLRQQGIRCYLATNQEKYRTSYILNQMGFAGLFDGIFSSAHLGCLKNDQAFFEHVLLSLPNVKADDMLFWDDSFGNVATAKAVGLQAERYHDFADFEKKIQRYLKG
jgi:putative hydrolase of the HAD superfamily